MMKALSVMRKEMLEVAHDRTMLAVLLAFPVFVMLFMGSSFHSMEINGLPIGVVGPTNASFAAALLDDINQSPAFKLQPYDSELAAMRAFRNGQLRAVIIIPDDFESALARGNGSAVRIAVDNSDLAMEQSVLAAMSSVVEASSTNITQSYVMAAWSDLGELNASASALADGIAETREGMLATKETLAEIRDDIDDVGVESLEDSLGEASQSVGSLSTLLDAQRAALQNMSEANEAALNRTGEFLANASAALNESVDVVEGTHAKLSGQVSKLNETALALDASIAGLEAIMAATPDGPTKTALGLNVDVLKSLRNATLQQISDTQAEMTELQSLNNTLHGFGAELEDYSDGLDDARGAGDVSGMEAALANASMRIGALNQSFASARADIAELKGLLSEIRETASDIEETLDDALEQTASVDALISSLQDTVAEQTGKDPGRIASPLSVSVENQYVRGSFVDFIMPQVIAVSLLLSCFLLGSISIVRERTRRTVLRALMAPGALGSLVAGKIAALVLLSFAQVVVILVVALALFGVQPPDNILMLAAGTGISALVLCSIGVLLGFFARTESAAIQSCLLLAIPMLFLGNIIFSPDLLPQYTQVLQQLLPLSHVTSIFKVVLITGGDPSLDVAALLSYFVLLAMLLGYIVMRRRDISDYS